VLFKKSLIKNKLGKSDFYASLPKNYKFDELQGEDFNVFYFTNIDTTIISFSEGFYFGNHPSEIKISKDSCKTGIMQGEVFNKKRKWRIYNCNNTRLIETIINNKYSSEWDKRIHIFGESKNKKDLNKLIDIYSTLNKG